MPCLVSCLQSVIGPSGGVNGGQLGIGLALERTAFDSCPWHSGLYPDVLNLSRVTWAKILVLPVKAPSFADSLAVQAQQWQLSCCCVGKQISLIILARGSALKLLCRVSLKHSHFKGCFKRLVWKSKTFVALSQLAIVLCVYLSERFVNSHQTYTSPSPIQCR